MTDYIFGKTISKDNYTPLRSLALKLTAKEFKKTSGFGFGVHNRVRRFTSFEAYKKNEKDRAEKYGYVKKRRNSERKTVSDVFSKLEKIEAEILKIKSYVSR